MNELLDDAKTDLFNDLTTKACHHISITLTSPQDFLLVVKLSVSPVHRVPKLDLVSFQIPLPVILFLYTSPFHNLSFHITFYFLRSPLFYSMCLFQTHYQPMILIFLNSIHFP